MAVYTNLTPMEIEMILLEYGLELVACSRIKTGILNTNYYIECPSEKFVMRIFEGNRSIEEENQELELLFELKDIIPCCTPIKTSKGKNYTLFQNKMIALFKFMEGEPIKKVNRGILKEIGEYLGKFHSFSAGKQLYRKSRVDMETYYEKIDFNAIPISTSEKMKISQLYERVRKFDFSNLPRGVIHNDIFPDNVFQKNGKIIGILDFNEAQTSFFIYDIAIVINYWIRINSFSKEKESEFISIFLEEYQKYRKLSEAEWRALDEAIIKMAITFILLRFNKFILENLNGVYIEDKNYSQLLPLLKSL